jgi:pilus assembly protein CpaB
LAIDEIISTTPKKAGSRRSASRAVTFTVIALVAGGSVAAILKSYVDRHLSSGPPMTLVVTATMDLPQATTLMAEHLSVTPWPSGSRPEGTYADPKELVGRVLLSKVVKNEAVLNTKLASREAGSGLASLLPENMRAAAVRVDDVVGVAGFIHPDDHVDVIVTMRPERGGETTSRVILQNVRVLAVGQQLGVDEQKRNQALPVTVATLLVSTEESEMLALASAQGRLLLTLRPWADRTQIATSGVIPTQLLATTRLRTEPARSSREQRLLARAAAASSVPSTAAAAPQPPAPETVEILRGDRFEQRKFEGKPPPRSPPVSASNPEAPMPRSGE